jgi:hypothetical protein
MYNPGNQVQVPGRRFWFLKGASLPYSFQKKKELLIEKLVRKVNDGLVSICSQQSQDKSILLIYWIFWSINEFPFFLRASKN